MEATLVNTAAQAIDIEKFMQDTGAEVTVSGTSAEQAQQALRELEKASIGQKQEWYDVRAQFMSDGSGAAKSVDFETLIGSPAMGDLITGLDDLAAEYGQYQRELNVAEARSNAFLNSIVGKCYAKYDLFLQQGEKEQKRILNRLDFAQYVQNFEGGLTAMRLANAESKKANGAGSALLTRDEKLVQAQQWANARELAVFDSAVLAQKVDATAGQIVLIATPLSGGKYAVRAGLSDKAVVNAALLAFYKVSKDAIANEQEEQAQASDVDQVDQLAAQAAAMAE
jgi:hypothetical protein